MNKVDLSHCEVPRGEVWRCLGYPDSVCAREDLQEMLQRVTESGRALLEPAGGYGILPVREVVSPVVDIAEDVRLHDADLALRLRGMSEFAALVVTAGSRIAQEAERLMQDGEHLRGYLLDAFASAAVNCMVYEVLRIIRNANCGASAYAACIGGKCPAFRDCGGAVAHWWSPGYGDWDVRENVSLLNILNASELGIHAEATGMITPRKSLVCVVPMGASVEPAGACVEWRRDWVRRGHVHGA